MRRCDSEWTFEASALRQDVRLPSRTPTEAPVHDSSDASESQRLGWGLSAGARFAKTVEY